MATKEIAKRQYVRADLEPELVLEEEPRGAGKTVARLTLLWEHRRFLFRCAAAGLIASTIIAFVISPRYTSTARLMPPDQTGQGMASMLAALGKATGDRGHRSRIARAESYGRHVHWGFTEPNCRGRSNQQV